MIYTPSSLRASHRRLARRIKKAARVLAKMRAGAALHLQYTRSGPYWALSNGTLVPESIAKLVVASSSVVSVGGGLFDGCLGQTWRWWQEEGDRHGTPII